MNEDEQNSDSPGEWDWLLFPRDEPPITLDALDRLLKLIVAEAVRDGCREVRIEKGHDGSPVVFQFADETRKRDVLPNRVFGALLGQVAARRDQNGRCDLSLPLADFACPVDVYVDSTDSKLRLVNAAPDE